MTGLMAGLLAWAIELGIAATMFMILRREENKVLKRRKKK
tara:strand:- start:185 stop:304 length:120 start_codon:yes stop_codon:yes gene_type:complete